MDVINTRHATPLSRAARVALHLAASVAFVVTVTIRFMEVVGFPNDHFLYIAAAQQMLWTDLPSRDFVDPGTPLMYAASALAQRAAGSPLLGEALLISVMFAIAAALTMYGAFRMSGSLSIAVLATAIEIALFPRTYHYPKLVALAAGMLAIWWYLDGPSTRRAAVVAACVVMAFLFRHDLGIYVGAAGALGVAGACRGWREAALRTASYFGFVAVFLSPYLAFVAATTGLPAHIASGLAYSRAEADRTGLPLQIFDVDAIASADNARVWLFYVFHVLPVVALAMVFRRLAREGSEAARVDAARLLPLAALAMAANVALLRDPLQGRLPDVAVTACLLAAWLVPRVWRSSSGWRVPVRVVMLTVIGVSLGAVNMVGTPWEQLDRASLLTPPVQWRGYFDEHVAELTNPRHPSQLPTRTVRGLVEFLEYVDRCTAPGDRLFVVGEAPEIYVAARRPFGGGQQALRPGYFSTVEDQQRLVQRLRAQRVPIALVLADTDAQTSFPLVMEELARTFQPVTEIRAHEEQVVEVRMHRDIESQGVDAATGLPCFT